MVHSLGYTSLRNQKVRLLGGCSNCKSTSLRSFIVLGLSIIMQMPCHTYHVNSVPADETAALAAVAIPNLASLCEYSHEELRDSQLSDPCIHVVFMLPQTNSEDKRLWQEWDQLTALNGLLYRIYKEPKQSWFQLVVPQENRNKILVELQEGVVGGHLGQEKTFSRVKDGFTGQGIGLILINGAKPVPVVLLENLLLFLEEPLWER